MIEPHRRADRPGTRTERVIVCACTYRRPEGLAALLKSFCLLEIPPDTEVEFCIVDNDVDTTAREVVEAAAADLPGPIRYVHERDPGIPSARNRALVEAGSRGFLAFVDDDETVDPRWLVELHNVAKATGATFIQGPVLMLVDDPEDRWWLDTKLFRQKVFPDRSPRDESWTNNVLIDMGFVAKSGCQFDDSLRFDGGSDTLFFRDVISAGGNGAFAARALVSEVQPKSRLNWSWAIQRQYRYGTTRANTMTLRVSRPRALAYCLVRGTGMIVVGLLRFSTVLARGRSGVADGVAYLARGTGVLLGGLGVRRLEYARKDAKK